MSYHKFCEFIKDLSKKVFEDERKQYPFYLEMLLFSIADKEIYEEIKSSVKITLRI